MKFFYLILITLSFNVHAIKGETLDQKEQSICKIEVKVPCPKDKSKECKGTCSATYIGQKKIMSAKHCLDLVTRSSAASLICEDKAPVKILKKPNWPFPGGDYDDSQDIAIMGLDKGPEVPAMDIVKSSEEFNSLIKKGSDCFLAGYGLDNNDQYGKQLVARAIDIQHEDVSRTTNGFYYFSVPEQVLLRQNYADHGDSGGALWCKKNGKNILMAVLQGGTKGSEFSYAERLTQGRDWIEYVMSPFGEKMELFKAHKSQLSFCSAIESCLDELKELKDFSIDTYNIIFKLFESAAKENLSELNIEGGTPYDQQLSEINYNIEQWSKLHTLCYDELYK